jgi:hypothetical protein
MFDHLRERLAVPMRQNPYMRWLRVVVGVGLVAGLGSVMWRHAYGEDQPIPIGSASVVGIVVFPVPEGPSLILSEAGKQGGFPIELVEGLIPDPLPGEMRQGFHCTRGSEITFHLSDGRSVSYGPCRVPSEIQGFEARMDGAVDDYGSQSPSVTSLEAAMLAAARAGAFQKPPTGTSWTFPVDCRVDRAGRFHGADLSGCAPATGRHRIRVGHVSLHSKQLHAVRICGPAVANRRRRTCLALTLTPDEAATIPLRLKVRIHDVPHDS